MDWYNPTLTVSIQGTTYKLSKTEVNELLEKLKEFPKPCEKSLFQIYERHKGPYMDDFDRTKIVHVKCTGNPDDQIHYYVTDEAIITEIAAGNKYRYDMMYMGKSIAYLSRE